MALFHLKSIASCALIISAVSAAAAAEPAATSNNNNNSTTTTQANQQNKPVAVANNPPVSAPSPSAPSAAKPVVQQPPSVVSATTPPSTCSVDLATAVDQLAAAKARLNDFEHARKLADQKAAEVAQEAAGLKHTLKELRLSLDSLVAENRALKDGSRYIFSAQKFNTLVQDSTVIGKAFLIGYKQTIERLLGPGSLDMAFEYFRDLYFTSLEPNAQKAVASMRIYYAQSGVHPFLKQVADPLYHQVVRLYQEAYAQGKILLESQTKRIINNLVKADPQIAKLIPNGTLADRLFCLGFLLVLVQQVIVPAITYIFSWIQYPFTLLLPATRKKAKKANNSSSSQRKAASSTKRSGRSSSPESVKLPDDLRRKVSETGSTTSITSGTKPVKLPDDLRRKVSETGSTTSITSGTKPVELPDDLPRKVSETGSTTTITSGKNPGSSRPQSQQTKSSTIPKTFVQATDTSAADPSSSKGENNPTLATFVQATDTSAADPSSSKGENNPTLATVSTTDSASAASNQRASAVSNQQKKKKQSSPQNY